MLCFTSFPILRLFDYDTTVDENTGLSMDASGEAVFLESSFVQSSKHEKADSEDDYRIPPEDDERKEEVARARNRKKKTTNTSKKRKKKDHTKQLQSEMLVKKPRAIRGEASGLPRPFNTLLEAAAAADDLDMS